MLDPFTDRARFDFERLASVAAVAVRALDNVLDLSYWPLEAQRAEAMAKRRIGLGITGLGDALVMLGLRYDADEGREMASRIARALRDAAYRASIELARERGPFPLFDREKYLEGKFVAQLPDDIREGIYAFGIRNSHLISVAPTGTISIAFGDNCSSGVEPPFAWYYERKVKNPDGTERVRFVYDHAYRLYKHLKGLDGRPDEEVVQTLPGHWRTALEIAAIDHVRMVAAVAPYVDSAVSKTVNVPESCPYEDFKDLYWESYRLGLKGCTTYRFNSKVASVLSTADATDDPQDLDESDPDRRIRLAETPQPVTASLRWVKRPTLPAGNPAWTFMVRHPHGYKFAVFVGHVENGEPYPFEVWVNGGEQPRGLGALAKSLSMDMRSNDRGWLRRKLEALAKAADDTAFDMPMPPTGEPARVPSIVAGFARLVLWRCEQLGAFAADGETPVLDALMSPKEPKTGPDGTLSWTVDVVNPATGDDFVLGLKELVLPDGTRRPYSVWLSGVYPKVLDGLCKSLSYDMRVIDPAWVGGKLRQLLTYTEPQGDFWAPEPGERRQRVYPSTVAYIARLIIHRHAMLGILDEAGYPVEAMGVVVETADEKVTPLRRSVGAMAVPGKRCEACGANAVIRRDGCDFCTACHHVGSCG